MTEYEARLVMGLGLPEEVIAIDCLDDEAAVEAAQLLLGNHDVELWRGRQKLGTLHHDAIVSSHHDGTADNVVPLRGPFGRSK
jgi:cobalamin biosynthesis protein CbiG